MMNKLKEVYVEQIQKKIINLRLRAAINMLLLLFVVMTTIAAKSRCAPSADIVVYVEIDYMNGYKTDQSIANHYLIESTKNESGKKKVIKDAWDEYGMPVTDNLTQSGFIYIANQHDNLSENNNWWIYVLGAKYFNTYDIGWTDDEGDPSSPSDNNHSVIARQRIEDIWNEDDEKEALQATVAHEILHQFGYGWGDHCSNSECLFYFQLDPENPSTWMCDFCMNKFKNGAP